MKPNENNGSEIFKTGTSVSEPPSWFDSLMKQIVELREERKHPRPKIAITAQEDPTALNNLVDMPSPISSLYGDIRDAINDYLHPRKIETSAEAVEVEEIWSKEKQSLPRLLSILGHVSVVTLLIIPWATSIPKLPKANETAVVVYNPVDLVLPVAP